MPATDAEPAAGGGHDEAVASGFAWTSLGRLALQAANLVALIVTSRHIRPEEFGLFAPAAIIASLTYAVADGTFATALLQRKVLLPDHVRVSFWASLLCALAASVALVAVSPFIERAFGFGHLAQVIIASTLMLPPRVVAAVPTALLQREMRFRELTTMSFATAVMARIVPTIVLAVAGFGVWALVAGYVIQAYADLALLLWRARPSVSWPRDWRYAHDVVGFGGRVMAIQSLNQLASNVDNVLVGRLLGAVALGFYSRIFALMMLPVNLLGSSAQQVLFPRLARCQDDPVKLRAQLDVAIDLVNGLALPLSALLIVVADSLVLVALGSTWAAIILPTRVLFAAVAFRIGFKVTDTLSIATASLMPTLWRQAAYAGLVAVGTLVGSRWGLTGVAAGVALAVIVMYLVSLGAAAGLVGASGHRLALLHLRGAAITAITVAPAAFVSSLAGDDLTGRLAGDVGAGLVFCASMAFVMFMGPRWLGGASAEILTNHAVRALRVVFPVSTPVRREEGRL
jgi:PST family polysaccharide transporter